MKVLVLSDIHGNVERLGEIIKLIHNKKLELILICGDLTNQGSKEETERVLEKLNGFRVLAVPGNVDTVHVVETLEEKGMSLHGKVKEIEGFSFVGFGGGSLETPGGFLESEETIKEGLLKLCKGKRNIVMVTHMPPFGTTIDASRSGGHIGSLAVKEVVEKVQPLVLLCGHAHNAFGEIKIGKTDCINIGEAREGRAILLELRKEGKIKWERIQL